MNKRVFAVRNIGKSLSISGTHIGRKERYLTKNGKILVFTSKIDAEQCINQLPFECKIVEIEYSPRNVFLEKVDKE